MFMLGYTRVMPDVPILLADDEHVWGGEWRRLQAERKERLEALCRAHGVKVPSQGSRLKLVQSLQAAIAEEERASTAVLTMRAARTSWSSSFAGRSSG